MNDVKSFTTNKICTYLPTDDIILIELIINYDSSYKIWGYKHEEIIELQDKYNTPIARMLYKTS